MSPLLQSPPEQSRFRVDTMAQTGAPSFVLLINSAPYSRDYFSRLGAMLEERGAKVTYVLDSHLSDVISDDDRAIEGGWYFTDYCRERLASGERPPSDDLRWDSLFSDFDRFITFGVDPPLGRESPIDYATTIGLLTHFFDDVFATIRPDAIVYEQVSNSFAMMAYRASQKNGVPFYSLAPARIPGHVEISSTGALKDHLTVGAILRDIRQSGANPESRMLAADYIASVDRQVPDYMRAGGDGAVLMSTNLVEKYVNREKLQRLVRVLRYRRRHREDSALAYQFGDPLVISWAMIRRAIARRLRIGRVTKLFQQKVRSSKYFVYPLHFHPEASTSVLAPDFVDELSVIKSIAFRLPTDVKLVVKEHPSATASQPYSFYKALDRLPNVELMAPELNAKELARDALGVICITSTLGFEAAALNKPVICFGDVLFAYFPNVRIINSYAALDEALVWALEYEPLEPEEILAAMSAYVEYADKGSFSFKGSLVNPQDMEHIADLLMAKIGRDAVRASRQPASDRMACG